MIKLRTMNLEAFRTRRDHYYLRERLKNDSAVCKYISSHFDTWIKKPISEDDYEVGGAYVICVNDDAVGMVGSTFMSSSGILDFWCCIDKQYRNQGYGEKVLVQTSQYLIENMKYLKNIKLNIQKDNIGSNKVAQNAGYSFTKEYRNSNIYHYYK